MRYKAHSQWGALMDAVKKFRYNRIKRLEKRFGKHHGPSRFDADEDSESNNGGGGKRGGGGHGNTRIPFGLCQREGIEIQKGWTPTDAWDALAGKGYSASEVYKQLRETGKAEKKKEPEKPKVDLTADRKTVSDYKSKLKENEDLTKEKEKVEKDIKNSEKKILIEKREVSWYSKMLAEYAEMEDQPDWIVSRSEDYKEKLKKSEDKIKRAEKKRDKSLKRKEEIDEQLGKFDAEKEKEKYDAAVDKILSESPYKDKVRDYRSVEEKSEDDRKELKKIDDTLSVCEQDLRLYKEKVEKARARGAETDAKFFEDHGVAFTEKKIELWKKKREEVAPRVSAYDKEMSDIKGDADNDEWDQVHELSIERDTVHDGPYSDDSFKTDSDNLKRDKVDYISPVKMVSEMSEEKIIKDLGGPDKTGGSCASLAIAYLMNKGGYKILDFRGGNSKSFFSYASGRFTRRLGGEVREGTDEFALSNELFTRVEEGKEYYFATGRHAAVIRKKDGVMQYLELQGYEDGNGWHTLNDKTLKSRFSCVHKSTHYGRLVMQRAYLCEGSKFTGNDDLVKLTGFINTAEKDQKKGAGGGIR